MTSQTPTSMTKELAKLPSKGRWLLSTFFRFLGFDESYSFRGMGTEERQFVDQWINDRREYLARIAVLLMITVHGGAIFMDPFVYPALASEFLRTAHIFIAGTAMVFLGWGIWTNTPIRLLVYLYTMLGVGAYGLGFAIIAAGQPTNSDLIAIACGFFGISTYTILLCPYGWWAMLAAAAANFLLGMYVTAGTDYAVAWNVVHAFTLFGAIVMASLQIYKTRLNARHEYRARLAASKAEKAKVKAAAELCQNIAHDVRKPFTMVKGLVGSIKDDLTFKNRHYVQGAASEIDRELENVESMLADLMQMDTEPTLHPQVMYVESLIRYVQTTICRARPNAEVSFRYDFAHQSALFVDKIKTQRVVMNLIDNAIDAIGMRGEIYFKSRDVGGNIEFCVGNYGPQIPKDKLAKLFDAFVTEGKEHGTGLGLAIARKYAQAHGGEIWCESGPQATEFWLRLPVAPNVPSLTIEPLCSTSAEVRGRGCRDQDSEQKESKNGGLKIAVLDDNAVFGMSWAETNSDHDVDYFASAETFLAHMATSPVYDVVIIDYYLDDPSGLNGSEVAKNLRSMMLCPTFLATNAETDEIDLTPFDAVIDKTPVEVSLLLPLAKQA